MHYATSYNFWTPLCAGSLGITRELDRRHSFFIQAVPIMWLNTLGCTFFLGATCCQDLSWRAISFATFGGEHSLGYSRHNATNVEKHDSQLQSSYASVCSKPWLTFERYFAGNTSVISKLQYNRKFTLVRCGQFRFLNCIALNVCQPWRKILYVLYVAYNRVIALRWLFCTLYKVTSHIH